jgi:hypothetical protein
MDRVFKIALDQRPTNLEIDNLFSKVSLKTETQQFKLQVEDKLRTKFLELDKAISNVKGEIAKLNVSNKEVQKKVAQGLSHGSA